MTSPVDICNRALGEMGARVTISSLTDNSNAAVYCSLNYTPLRQQLLRAAHWAFARKTQQMTLLGTLMANPPTSPIPWNFKYAYPSDCLAIRYCLPPPPTLTQSTTVPATGLQFFIPWCAPSREFRFVPAYDDTVSPPQRVILTNLGLSGTSSSIIGGALCVYTVDVTDPDMWDSLFTDAMVQGLANKLVIPLSGNIKLKQGFAQAAERAIMIARAADGNEAIPSADHSVDWIRIRGSHNPYGSGFSGSGFGDGGGGEWFGAYSNVNWGG